MYGPDNSSPTEYVNTCSSDGNFHDTLYHRIGLFLVCKSRKKKDTKGKKGITALVSVFCSLLILYAGTLFYYKEQVQYAVEKYGNMQEVQELGLDRAIWNLTTVLGRRSTTVGTIVYVGGL